MAVTPNYSWPVPVNTDYVKDGAEAIKDLGDAIDATVFGLPSGALALVKTQTIGTAVSSVTVSDAFSATYDNYKIIVSDGAGSIENYINFRVGSATTGYYNNRWAYEYPATTSSNAPTNNGGYWNYIGWSSVNFNTFTMEIQSPFLAKNTIFSSSWGGNTFGATCQGYQSTASSWTSFQIVKNSGTMTGGTIRVYGYQN